MAAGAAQGQQQMLLQATLMQQLQQQANSVSCFIILSPKKTRLLALKRIRMKKYNELILFCFCCAAKPSKSVEYAWKLPD